MQIHIVTVSWSSHQPKLARIRQQVFTEEQGVPADIDQDGEDPAATHILALSEAGQEVGCARLLVTGQIGRMAVLSDWRRQGIGTRLLASAIENAQAAGLTRVFLHAQSQASAFYRRHGFVDVGGEFIEAGMPHRAMEMPLPIPFEAPEDVPKATVREQPVTADADKAELVHLRGESECLQGLEDVLAEPRRHVEIYSPQLDHLLFDAPNVVQALSTFARRGPPAHLRVLIHTSDLVVGRGHRLLELARRMDSKIEIRRVPDELASDVHTYVIWDNLGYWLMPDFREYDGLCNRHDPVQASRLRERFDYLWHKGQPDPELRTLRL